MLFQQLLFRPVLSCRTKGGGLLIGDSGLGTDDAKYFSQDCFEFDFSDRHTRPPGREDPIGMPVGTFFGILMCHHYNAATRGVGQMKQAGIRPNNHGTTSRQAARRQQIGPGGDREVLQRSRPQSRAIRWTAAKQNLDFQIAQPPAKRQPFFQRPILVWSTGKRLDKNGRLVRF